LFVVLLEPGRIYDPTQVKHRPGLHKGAQQPRLWKIDDVGCTGLDTVCNSGFELVGALVLNVNPCLLLEAQNGILKLADIITGKRPEHRDSGAGVFADQSVS